MNKRRFQVGQMVWVLGQDSEMRFILRNGVVYAYDPDLVVLIEFEPHKMIGQRDQDDVYVTAAEAQSVLDRRAARKAATA